MTGPTDPPTERGDVGHANWENTMPDDTSKTGSDRKLISLEQDYEARDWAKSLGCMPEQLRAAVKAVGNSTDAVREYLSARRAKHAMALNALTQLGLPRLIRRALIILGRIAKLAPCDFHRIALPMDRPQFQGPIQHIVKRRVPLCEALHLCGKLLRPPNHSISP